MGDRQAGTTTHPEAVALVAPERVALRMADSGEVLRYGELVASANRIARVFRDLGLGHGTTIACLLPNGPALFEVAWAAKNGGLRYVMVGTRLNAADIGYIVRDSGARALVTTEDYADLAASLGLAEQGVRLLLVQGTRGGFTDLRELANAADVAPLPERRRGASMLYSSGTTGRPKGVKAQLADVPPEEPPARHAGLLRAYGLCGDSVFVTAAPLYHAGPLRIAMAVQRAGGTVVTMRRFEPEAMLSAIATWRATHGFFVPTMFQRLLDLPEAVRRRYDLSSMRHAIHGAAPCPQIVKRAMIDWWGPVIDELYGGTESIGQTYISAEEWLRHPGSVGKPSGHVEVRIVDEAGTVLPAGEVGLVTVRNPQRFAYHGAAAAAAGPVYDADGFASLGDVGYLDAEGYLYLTDRQSNTIISGGVNVYPQEAEAVLLAHEDVADAAVVGIPDRDLGEAAKALVVLKPGREPDARTAAAIAAFCADRLSRYKCPRSIDFVAELPRSDLGKLARKSIAPDLRTSPGRF